MNAELFRDPRDIRLRDAVGQIDLLGIFVLCALEKMYPETVKRARLAWMSKTRDARKTLDPVLFTLESYGYATHTGEPSHESWRITDYGRDTLHALIASQAASTVALPSATQPSLPMNAQSAAAPWRENLSGPIYSSIDLDRSKKSIDQIDQEEDQPAPEKFSAPASEDAPDRLQSVSAWCVTNGVTGDKRDKVLRDPWCTVARLDGWLKYWQAEGQTAKGEPFRNKWGALNYSLACCLNPKRTDPPTFSEDAGDDDPAEPEEPKIVAEKISDGVYATCPAVSDKDAQIWQAVLGELSLEMTKATFDTWVKSALVYSVNGDHWTIGVPNAYAVEWLTNRLMSTVRRVMIGITGNAVTVEFICPKK